MKLGLAALRVVIGALFFGHGAQKLFGWFGGHGLEGTSGFFESIGLRPGRRHATAAGASEAAGGALLAAGLFTPAASAMITGVMSQAIRTVHGAKGIWNTGGGYEYNLVLIAAALALADAGPGDWSLDHALGIERKGPFWALAALGAGIAGPSLLMRLSEADQAGGEEPAAAPVPAEAAAQETELVPA